MKYLCVVHHCETAYLGHNVQDAFELARQDDSSVELTDCDFYEVGQEVKVVLEYKTVPVINKVAKNATRK